MIRRLVTTMLMVLAIGASAQKQEKRVFDPDKLSSISVPEDWRLVPDEERVTPKRPRNLAVSCEYTAEDKCRVILMVVKKDGFREGKREISPPDFAESLIQGFVKAADAVAIRDGGVGKMGGLKSANLHVIHSKGKVILETYITVAQDERHVYAIIGLYQVSDYGKRGREISEMIQSFQLSEAVN